MTKRMICALGHSHLAPAKLGWDVLAQEYPKFGFDFFGFAPGSQTSFIEDVKAKGRVLTTESESLLKGFRMTSGGRSEIDGTAYCAFVNFGLGIGGPNLLVRAICSNYRLAAHATPSTFIISKPCLSAAIEAYLRSGQALAPVRMIRSVSDAPIIYHSTPMPTSRIVGDPNYAQEALSIPGVVSTIKEIFDAKSAEVGAVESYRYLSQPASTLDEHGYTKDEYIANGVNWGGGA